MGPAMQTFFKLLLLSFAVGVAFAAMGVHPLGLWQDLWGTVEDLFHVSGDLVRWSIKYVLLGAIVVVPIWLIARLIGLLGERRDRSAQ